MRLHTEHTTMEETVHKHKQALVSQALSHAKGHYLAAVSFNRSVAGWEWDPGSVPSLQGCTILQSQHISVSAGYMCAHTDTKVYVSGGLVHLNPSEEMHSTASATAVPI